MQPATIPRSRGLPLVGSALHYFANPLGFLERTAREGGDLVELDLATRRAWLLGDPADVEQVLLRSAGSVQKDVFLRELKQLLGEGLLTAEGAFWKRQRRLIQPAFHRERIAGYGRTMVADTLRALEAWKDGATLDVHHETMSLTSDIVSHALFGADVADTRVVAWCLDVVMRRFADPLYLLVPAMDRLPLPANRRIRDAKAKLDSVVHGFIQRRREQGDAGDGDDLLAMLLAARDEDGSAMDDRTVRDEVLVLFLAGHETTALALSWALHLLSENPRVEARLHEEIAVLGGAPPTFDDLPKLRYVEHVASEVLRLYPPAWALGREATAPVEVAGRTFATGSWFWMVPWVLHRDRRWFDDPLAFRPERWEDGLAKRLPRFAYLPFGGGPRVCIGNQFALMELVLVLTTIAQRFELRTVSRHRVVPDPSVTLRFKHGLRMTARARRAA